MGNLTDAARCRLAYIEASKAMDSIALDATHGFLRTCPARFRVKANNQEVECMHTNEQISLYASLRTLLLGLIFLLAAALGLAQPVAAQAPTSKPAVAGNPPFAGQAALPAALSEAIEQARYQIRTAAHNEAVPSFQMDNPVHALRAA